MTEQTNSRYDESNSFRFTIPELPRGQQLVFNLKSTWGDRHYIGLNGIEIFSSDGYPVPIRKVSQYFFVESEREIQGIRCLPDRLLQTLQTSIFFLNMAMIHVL